MKWFTRSRGLLAGLVALALASCLASGSQAATIRVAQESSAGAGDFDANIIGFIDTFSFAGSISTFYSYGNPNGSSYNGEGNGGPNPVSGVTQIFLVEATDGLSLVVVHDAANDGSGGAANTRWDLSGDTAAFLVSDDSGEGEVAAGGTQFDITKNWAVCCTDGYAIGSLDGSWTLFGQFLQAPTNQTGWNAVSSNATTLGLNLAVGRRVRLDVSAVPEPATWMLMSTGLAALRGLRRRCAPRT